MHRHATDPVSLIFGAVFTGFTLVWVAVLADWIDRDDAWWAGPVVLIGAGAAGLVAALRPRPDENSRPSET